MGGAPRCGGLSKLRCLLPGGMYPFTHPSFSNEFESWNWIGEGTGDICLSLPLTLRNEGWKSMYGDPKRSQPPSTTALPSPASGPERPRPPQSGCRVNTGSGEVVEQRPDQPVSRPRLPGRPSLRVRFRSARAPSTPSRAAWAWLPDPGVGSAAGISREQGLILDEPPCKPRSTAGTAGVVGAPLSIPILRAS